jgi:hypothetical protein
MPVPQKLREVSQTTIGNLICFFFAILVLIVSITTGITIRIAITMTM